MGSGAARTTRRLLWGGPLAAVLIVLGSTLGWLLEDGYDPWTQEISDLGALTTDAAWVWNLADSLSGVALLCCAVGLWRAAGSARGLRIAAALVAVGGVASVLDGLLREDCPESTDPACEAREDAGALSWHHEAHVIESAIDVLAAIAAPLAVALARAGTSPRLRRWSLLAAALIAVTFGAYPVLRGDPGGGGVQRAGVTVYLAWIVGLSLREMRRLERAPNGSRASGGGD